MTGQGYCYISLYIVSSSRMPFLKERPHATRASLMGIHRSALLLSRVMWRGLQKDWLSSPSVVSDTSLTNSACQLTSFHSLRMISSVDSSFSINWKAFLPSRMEASSGKSISSFSHQARTLKHSTTTVLECLPPKPERFQLR